MICSRNFNDRGGPYFMASLAVAGAAYLLAIHELYVTQTLPRRVVIIGLLLASVWHIVFVRMPPGVDDDIHRYVWDGRLQRLGYNPYLVIPSDPDFRGLHTPETRNLNNPDLPSPYPPGAQFFFRGVTAIQESAFALKIAFVLCEVIVVFVLFDLMRGNRLAPHLVLAFAWNPLLAIEVAGSGHVDIVGAMLLVMSAAALAHRWRSAAAVTFGLAVAVKFLPIVLVPLYWKRIRTRDAILVPAVIGLLYLPFLDHGRIPTGSLATYIQTFRFNGPVFALFDRVAPPQLLTGLAVLTGLATSIWLSGAAKPFTRGSFAWPMAAALFCGPVVFPWYLLWLLPFLTSASTLLIAVWTVSIIPTYVQWHLRRLGHPWGALPGWIMLLEYGSVGIVAAIMILRRLMRRQGTQYESRRV
jgi:hypothetical protein